MATLGSPSPPGSPSARRRRNCARKVERACCNTILYFPLLFVYGLTTWAVWVNIKIGLMPTKGWTGHTTIFLGTFFYLLLNWSYTAAVFTNPGSPLDHKGGYSQLPTSETPAYSSFTVKSTGDIRFCKKCQTKKPDRAHHCSTCKRCVLKMDHHCPWLATCVGLRNYKAFLLFLTYVAIFCWVCFFASVSWIYAEILSDAQYLESIMPVNFILLAVLSGIIGLVITGFTAWHLYLTSTGYTTIEKLEKTRYLSPIRKSLQYHPPARTYVDQDGRQSISNQIREIHANALPGILRPEEGETSRPNSPAMNIGSSPAQRSLHRNYHEMESQRERDRYADYLEEKDSESLPHAFDLGWKRNFVHVFGEKKHLWLLPIPSSTSDGWQWEPSPRWIRARDQIKRTRESQQRVQKERERAAGWGHDSPSDSPRIPKPDWYGYSTGGGEETQDERYLTTSNGVTQVSAGRRSPGKADSILGRIPGTYIDDGQGMGTPMQFLDHHRRRRGQEADLFDDEIDNYDTSSDEERSQKVPPQDSTTASIGNMSRTATPSTENWNDLPEHILSGDRMAKGKGSSSKAQERRAKQRGWDLRSQK